jgi:hypothetical protein
MRGSHAPIRISSDKVIQSDSFFVGKSLVAFFDFSGFGVGFPHPIACGTPWRNLKARSPCGNNDPTPEKKAAGGKRKAWRPPRPPRYPPRRNAPAPGYNATRKNARNNAHHCATKSHIAAWVKPGDFHHTRFLTAGGRLPMALPDSMKRATTDRSARWRQRCRCRVDGVAVGCRCRRIRRVALPWRCPVAAGVDFSLAGCRHPLLGRVQAILRGGCGKGSTRR